MDNFDKIKQKKKLFLIYLSFSLLALHSYDKRKHNHNLDYEILVNQEAFASYSNGLIYIGDQEYLSSLKNVNTCDILVEDCRNSIKNPDMIIHSSYKISDIKVRNEILEVLCIYEKYYPSNWNRSLDSMKLEWTIHNLCYTFDFKRDHTTDVDLDNNDEKKFDKKLINSILGL